MPFDLYLIPCGKDLPSRIDDKCAPLDTHILTAVQFFLDPDAECADYGLFRVGKKRDGQLLFLDKLPMTDSGVRTYAKYLRVEP